MANDVKQWMKNIPYLTAIGLIMYAMIGTCLDITFAV